MPDKREPLLLLDNSTMYVIGAGDYHSTNLSFEEAKAIIDMYSTEDILRCFTDRATEQVLHDFVGIEPRNFAYKPIRKMRVGQDAIAVKLHITPSETQPEVEASDGVTAKKIQNVYVYCQYITRTSLIKKLGGLLSGRPLFCVKVSFSYHFSFQGGRGPAYHSPWG